MHTAVAVAEPCVTETFDRPVPGATNVVTRHVDVPSPQFPGLWQEGEIEGYFYAIYANGEGSVQPSRTLPEWSITFSCDVITETCTRARQGGLPPAGADRVTDILEQCFFPRKAAQEQSLRPPGVEEPAVEPAPPTCGAVALPQGEPGITLQRLLVLVGADPGPIDGYPGQRTRDAMVQILGLQSTNMSIVDAINALNTLLCEPSKD